MGRSSFTQRENGVDNVLLRAGTAVADHITQSVNPIKEAGPFNPPSIATQTEQEKITLRISIKHNASTNPGPLNKGANGDMLNAVFFLLAERTNSLSLAPTRSWPTVVQGFEINKENRRLNNFAQCL